MEQLEDALRVLQVPQRMHAERLEGGPGREAVPKHVSRGAGEQDLAPVAGLEEAGHPAERRPKVIAVAQLGLAGVEGDANLEERMKDEG